MSTAESKKLNRWHLWLTAFALHACVTWIGLEIFGDNYMWVMAADPWIKDVMPPPLSTIFNFPCGLLCAGCACAAAWIVTRAFHPGTFSLVFFLVAAGVSALVVAMLRGNFVVITGPLSYGPGNQAWYFRPAGERVLFSGLAALGVTVIDGLLLSVGVTIMRVSE